jgi:hypothetical protein
MWLTERLALDHKTIADFRKDNGRAIRKVCSQVVSLCRQLGLFAEASVAIDGSKFRAVNNRDKNFTAAKMQRRLAQIEKSVARYLDHLDSAICPAGERLTCRFTREENGLAIRRDWTTVCTACALKAQCTPGKERRVSRWEHEGVVEAVERRLDENPQAAPAPRDRRASLRHHQDVDGCHALRDEEAEERSHRDGAERPRP